MPPESTSDEPPLLPELTRARRAIVVVDVVESVRLMQDDEAGFIERWRRFVHQVRNEVLPAHGGRLVKSLGDGMLLEFESVRSAVTAALGLQHRAGAADAGAQAARLWLRCGVHVAEVVVDEDDVFGAGVNLAARLASLAGPGETVGSTEVRDELTEGLDGEIEDLGLCYLKHLAQPIRAWRLSTRGPAPRPASADPGALRPTLLVMPWTALDMAQQAADLPLGRLLADDLVAALSASREWNVISRLSSARLTVDGSAEPAQLQQATGATYALSGWWQDAGTSVAVHAELCDLRDGLVIWADRFSAQRDDILGEERALARQILAGMCRALMAKETTRVAASALPNLADYSLLLAAMGSMHHMSTPSVERAGQTLMHLEQRHPRLPEPKAWLAKWHVIRIAQDWSASPTADAGQARELLRRALDAMPDHAMSLTIDGLVSAFIDRRQDIAEQRYRRALACNDNEPLAWLFLSSVHAHRGEGASAMHCVCKARALSPLDPMGYYFVGFHAWACLADGAHDEAVRLAKQALRANREHLPALVTLTMAQALAGQLDAARMTAQMLLDQAARVPGRRYFSVSNYLAGFPDGGSGPHARKLGDALLAAGVPH